MKIETRKKFPVFDSHQLTSNYTVLNIWGMGKQKFGGNKTWFKLWILNDHNLNIHF